MRHRSVLVSVLSCALAILVSLPLAGAELYGKPLRGLSPVSLEELERDPGPYANRAIRVSGVGRDGDAAKVTLTQGKASLVVRTDGRFTLPDDLDGARVTAEGRLKGGALVATGVEVER